MKALIQQNIQPPYVENKVDKVEGKQLSTEDYTTEEKNKLAGIAAEANNYTHPINHPPSIITQDENNRFVTDAEKSTWNSKASANVATISANGLMSNIDKIKLDGVDIGANNYIHPANHSASIITQDENNRFMTDTERNKLANLSTVATTGSYNDLSDKPEASSGKRVLRYTIGTSTSGWTASDCDYLCDGTDDNVQIQAAIDALPLNGGEIVILDGVYNISAIITQTNKNNITIKGNGNSTRLNRVGTIRSLFLFTSCNFITIKNLMAYGDHEHVTAWFALGEFETCHNLLLENLYFYDCYTGVYLDTCNDARILYCNGHCTTVKPNNYALDCYGGNNLLIQGCQFPAYQDMVLYVQEVTGLIQIIDNIINLNSYPSAGVSFPIYIEHSDPPYDTCKTIVKGNIITHSDFDGIYISGSADNIVSDNYVQCLSGGGMFLWEVDRSIISGNTVVGVFTSGINLADSSDSTIQNNTIIKNGTYLSTKAPILVEGESDYNLIINNNCKGKAPLVTGGTGNSVYGNKVDGSAGLPVSGMDWVEVQTYNTAGTYTWTAPDYFNGENYLVGAFVMGGGGAGGAGRHITTTTSYAGGGGGAAGFINNIVMTVSPAQQIPVVVGAGGVPANNATGGSGGTSSFNGQTALGGGGGTSVTLSFGKFDGNAGGTTASGGYILNNGGYYTSPEPPKYATVHLPIMAISGTTFLEWRQTVGQDPATYINKFDMTNWGMAGGCAGACSKSASNTGNRQIGATGMNGGTSGSGNYHSNGGDAVGENATENGSGGGGAAVTVYGSTAGNAIGGNGAPGIVKIYVKKLVTL